MATLKDIADRAGVSIGTVDRILHNRGRFSAETAERVLSIVDEVDYRPNVLAKRLSQSRTCRIGVLLPWPDQDSGYWQLTMEGISRAGQDLGPFGLSLDIVNFDRYDPSGLQTGGNRICSEDYDGVLLAPLRANESRLILNRLGTTVPVVCIDTDLPGSTRLCYIGQDSSLSGRLAGRLMNLLIGRSHRGDVLVISPDADNEHLDRRASGFLEVFEGSSRHKRVTIESDHDVTLLREFLDNEVRCRPSGIFVTDASAHFVADYLNTREDGFHRHISLIGYDLVPENRRWLENGTIDFLLTQRPDEQGYDGVSRLFKTIVLGETPPEHVFTPIDIITRENVQIPPRGKNKGGRPMSAKTGYLEMKRECYELNMEIPRRSLAIYTWGNVSIISRELGVFAIKPSGISYDILRPEDIVIVDMESKVVEGEMNPSSDTPTHAVLYRAFTGIGGIVHTHSPYAVGWAQALEPITIYGTTHADHTVRDIPCTTPMSDESIKGNYEVETGVQIVEHFRKAGLNPEETEMVLVGSHGPFTWGVTGAKAVYNAVVVEELARMATITRQVNPGVMPLKETLRSKHYERKHGVNAYYGQKK